MAIRKSPERYTAEYKWGLVKRLLAGEAPTAVAQETGVARRLLYHWREQYRQHGAAGLKPYGRPRKAQVQSASSTGASQRIATLERKVGHQELVMDFFEAALRRLEDKSLAKKHAGGNKCTP